MRRTGLVYGGLPGGELLEAVYCADLTTITTIDQIGMAIRSAAMTASAPEEKKKLAVAQNWAEIIGQKS